MNNLIQDIIDNIELKPCPFCGANANIGVYIRHSVMSEPYYQARIECSDSSCKATIVKVNYNVASTTKEDMMETVISAWNSRVVDREID